MDNKIKDLIYGSLIGDAMGVQFEFYEKKNIPKIDNLQYEDSKVLPIKAGNWSDDGDQMLLLYQAMKESENDVVPHLLYAKKIYDWYHKGIPEINKHTGIGCGNNMYMVLTHSKYLDDPLLASKEIYEKTKSHSNGSIMRISILGLSSLDKNIVIQNTINVCKITNYSSLVQASCLAVTLLVHYINIKEFNIHDLYETNNICLKIINDIFDTIKLEKNELMDLIKHINCKSIDDLKLDEEFKIGYCLKTMGCLFWAIRNIGLGYKNILKTIYQEGGDTDTNGIVTGGVISLILGIKCIPTEWINELKYTDYVNELLSVH